MIVNFEISGAGIAGDPDKLLYATTDTGVRVHTLFNSMSLFGLSFYFARKRLIRMIKRKTIEI